MPSPGVVVEAAKTDKSVNKYINNNTYTQTQEPDCQQIYKRNEIFVSFFSVPPFGMNIHMTMAGFLIVKVKRCES